MKQTQDFSDRRHKAWCIHCNDALAQKETNRDHVPSKVFLGTPLPDNLPVVEICMKCNVSFSSDEEYFAALLGSILAGSTDPARQSIPSARRILSENDGLRARIENSKREYQTHGGETKVYWTPDTKRVNNVVLKNARGHAYFEFGEPLFSGAFTVSSWPLESLTTSERVSFEANDMGEFWPEVGSRMMDRLVTGKDLDGGWVVVEPGVYRYALSLIDDELVVRSVIYEYLATEVTWEV